MNLILRLLAALLVIQSLVAVKVKAKEAAVDVSSEFYDAFGYSESHIDKLSMLEKRRMGSPRSSPRPRSLNLSRRSHRYRHLNQLWYRPPCLISSHLCARRLYQPVFHSHLALLPFLPHLSQFHLHPSQSLPHLFQCPKLLPRCPRIPPPLPSLPRVLRCH
jgi:hypothetical protein